MINNYVHSIVELAQRAVQLEVGAAQPGRAAKRIVARHSKQIKDIINENKAKHESRTATAKLPKDLKNTIYLQNKVDIAKTDSAHSGSIINYKIDGIPNVDPETFLSVVKFKVNRLLNRDEKGNVRRESIKVMLQLICEMEQVTVNGTVTAELVFLSRQETKYAATNMNELYRKFTDNILESMATFNQKR